MAYGNLDEEQRGAKLAHVERRVLTSGWVPDCILNETHDCYGCPFEDVQSCPVTMDEDYCSYLLWLRDRYLEYEWLRQKRVRVLKEILRRHKLPLHWEVLAALAFRAAPDLFDSANSVRGLVHFNPDIFYMESDGVFGLAEWQKWSLR